MGNWDKERLSPCWKSNNFKAWNPGFCSSSHGFPENVNWMIAFDGNLLFQGADVAWKTKGSEPTPDFIEFVFSGAVKPPEIGCASGWDTREAARGGDAPTHLHPCLYVFQLCFYDASGVNWDQAVLLSHPQSQTRLHCLVWIPRNICRAWSKSCSKVTFRESLYSSEVLCQLSLSSFEAVCVSLCLCWTVGHRLF